MSESKSIFKHMDAGLFKAVDVLKASTAYDSLSGKIQSLPDTQQRIISQALNGILLLLPIAIVALIFLSNQRMRTELSTKKEIASLVKGHSDRKNELSQYGKDVFSPLAAKNQQDFVNKLRSALSSRGIPKGNILVSNFKLESTGASVNRVSATIKFNKMHMEQFSSFLNILQVNQKVKVINTSIKKDLDKRLLYGHLDILQISRI